MEVNEVVFAVSVPPKTAVPEIVTVPDNVALSVENVAAELSGDAK